MNLNITKKILEKTTSILPVQVIGDSSSIFHVTVTRSSDGRSYNFETNSFPATVTSKSRLKNQSPGTFNLTIPTAASGDTYDIVIMAEPHYNTRLSIGNGIRYGKTITQLGDATINFIAAATNATNTTIGNSTGSPTSIISSSGGDTVPMDNLQLTVPAAAGDYGYFIKTVNLTDELSPITGTRDLSKGTFDSGSFYWSTTETVDGAISSSTSLVVDDLSNLVVGMELISSTAGGDSIGTDAKITSIDIDTKTLTLSAASSLTNNATLTFRAYGTRLIEKAIGIGFNLTSPSITLGQTVTTLDDEITSSVSEDTEFNVNGTTGIGVGATIRMRGLEKSLDTGVATVVGIDSSANGGGITGGAFAVTNARISASSDRPIRSKTKIYIDGSSNQVYLSGVINVTKYPTSNQDIILDLNKVLTLGTAV